MANARIDDNFNPTLIGVSSADGQTPLRAEINPVTGGLIVEQTTGVLVPESFDFIDAAYPDSITETYTYKTGGSGGASVAVVTVIYTDATKENIDTVTRT